MQDRLPVSGRFFHDASVPIPTNSRIVESLGPMMLPSFHDDYLVGYAVDCDARHVVLRIGMQSHRRFGKSSSTV